MPGDAKRAEDRAPARAGASAYVARAGIVAALG
jgi:hypothetical protein